ncbi:hypothetical protein B4W97_003087 [Salmonella enterica subsp. enterica serovar Ohio]|uniref:Uncharacterized protein n=2 Tax=Salmonella enterica TaxID=28901 RepID=A0A5U5KBF6_SALER|nr:hypothetical protein CHC58_05095 [Salmonella enterica]AXE11723.1 hypothetical protein DOE64_05095 [Salmonella enterica subsp. enterica serovar Ohio]EAA3932319.1 hypothetical protein [Salmonella enterica subsp. enterica serovar Livingstone]EAW2279541.1 hypothetical protein [Salmonella enterica subsp. enterica]EBB4403855.1 hypothetical protein [Salmonella enterica subsp. enterica serovar Typhimurium]EBC8086976.1 hypothetical protein [Salmonella enterica subsp. enterica serovar Infantis]EBH52
MLSKTGFTHSDLLCWQIDYAGGSLNVNGTIMRDTYKFLSWVSFENDFSRATECRLNIDT